MGVLVRGRVKELLWGSFVGHRQGSLRELGRGEDITILGNASHRTSGRKPEHEFLLQ